MTKFINSVAIVLSRTDFAEADRIIKLLTPDQGKISVLAKGVRKTKSKLAGGVELFSVTEIGYIPGRGELGTLTSSRLTKHYANIVKNLARTETAYDFIKRLNKATEDHPEPAYFDLLKKALEALDDHAIDLELIKVWFGAQLLRLAGHSPNLKTDDNGEKLDANNSYLFNYESMCFIKDGVHDNSFKPNDIKFLRLIFGDSLPSALQKVSGVNNLAETARPLIGSMCQTYIRF